MVLNVFDLRCPQPRTQHEKEAEKMNFLFMLLLCAFGNTHHFRGGRQTVRDQRRSYTTLVKLSALDDGTVNTDINETARRIWRSTFPRTQPWSTTNHLTLNQFIDSKLLLHRCCEESKLHTNSCVTD